MRRRHPPSPPPTAPLDDDDLLAEILLRLPPQPCSLPRASAVCKRWRSLASDPGFSRRFLRHHRRNPPLLGCFMQNGQQLHSEPTMEPPNRVPPARFSFPTDTGNRRFLCLGCRHGLVLMRHTSGVNTELLVWDPVNGHEHRLAIPPNFGEKAVHAAAAVLRSALGDIHHFQVVLVSTDEQNARVVGCLYSSETGVWGDVISTNVSDLLLTVIDRIRPAVLVGDSIYMMLLGKSAGIVEFDIDRQILAVIPLPMSPDSNFRRFYSVMRADGGGLGLLVVSFLECSFQFWKRNTDCDGVATWVLARTIELDKLLPLNSQNRSALMLQGFSEENNVVFLRTMVGVFMIQLDSLQFKKLDITLHRWLPFEGVYAAGI